MKRLLENSFMISFISFFYLSIFLLPLMFCILMFFLCLIYTINTEDEDDRQHTHDDEE